MKKELDEKLCRKYPNLYKDRHGDMRQTCMCWGFPGDGWYDLIDELSAKLEPLGAVADQVKEKFGTLRFYYHFDPREDNNYPYDAADDAVNEAEEKSAKTCELCGKEGKVNSTGFWLACRCPGCEGKTWRDMENEA